MILCIDIMHAIIIIIACTINSIMCLHHAMRHAITTLNFKGYSQADKALAGYGRHSSGGECLEGFKMVLYVLPSLTGTTLSVTTLSVTPTDLATATVTEGKTTTEVSNARETTSEDLTMDYTIGTTTDGTATIAGVNSLKFVLVFVTSILLSV